MRAEVRLADGADPSELSRLLIGTTGCVATANSDDTFSSEFFLCRDGGAYTIETPWDLVRERWTSVMVDGAMYLAFLLIPGERIRTPRLRIERDIVLACDLVQASPAISPDGLVAILAFDDDAGNRRHIASLPMRPGDRNEVSVRFGLGMLEGRTGRFSIECDPGPESDPRSDWLGVTTWIVGRFDRLGLLGARANKRWRAENELKHFAVSYDRELLTQRAEPAEDEPRQPAELVRSGWTAPSVDEPLALPPASDVDGLLADARFDVLARDDVYTYAHRALETLLGTAPPDFAARLSRLSADRGPLDVLSLCSGNGRIERTLITQAGVHVNLTVIDINEHLLSQAERKLAPLASITAVLADVNDISLETRPERFDLALFVAGLHHVVELERVLDQLSRALRPSGELWLIGEQIGRNGNRLWPDAARVANALFAELPAELRRNHDTGAVDDTLPPLDFSSSSFEGIRSEEIEPLLEAYFEAVEIYRRNCFMWRLVGSAYAANYDLSKQAHRAAALKIVLAEYRLWRAGGRPTETFSIFRRR